MKTNNMLIKLYLVVILTAALPSFAAIIFTTGNVQYNNVNIAAAITAITVTGQATIGSQVLYVYFTGGVGPDGITPILLHGQHGVAFVENVADALNSTPQVGFSALTINPQAGYGFTAGDFKIDELNSGANPGSVTLQGINLLGVVFSQTFALSPSGQEPFRFYTTGGDVVTSLTIRSPQNSLLADIKQVSVDMAPAIPEPATVFAGVLVLLPLGASIVRMLNKSKQQ